MGKKAMKRKFLLAVLTAFLLGLVFFSPVLTGQGEEDFVVYWSALRLLVSGGDPYDPGAMEVTIHSVRPGRAWGRGVAWNLPWLLLLLAPLGWLPFDIAVRVWLLLNLGLIGWTVLLIWQAFRPDGKGGVVALVVGLLFGGTLSALQMGQITVLVLLALVLCIRWLMAGRDFCAGAILLLATIKPHLAYFCVFLLLVWTIRERRWRVWLGGSVALVAALVLSWLMLPDWLSSYLALMRDAPVLTYSTATLGGVAQQLWGVGWLRWSGVLLIPLAWPFTRLIARYGWPISLSLALLISLPLAPYGFGFDQLMLLPAILLLLTWVLDGRLPPRETYFLIGGLIAIYSGLFWLLTLPGLPYHYLAWVPFAIASLYAVLWKRSPLNQFQMTASVGKGA